MKQEYSREIRLGVYLARRKEGHDWTLDWYVDGTEIKGLQAT